MAEPGPLIEHAVRLAGEDGLTLQQLRAVFARPIGKERLERGLTFARSPGLIREQRERGPNRARRMQEQVVSTESVPAQYPSRAHEA